MFEIKNVNLSKNNFGEDTIMGDNKFNTLNLSQLVSDVIDVEDNYVYDKTKKLFKFVNFNKIIGRKMKPDYIYIKCNPSKVNTQGGLDANNLDYIQIQQNETCKNGMFIDMYPFTKVKNPALYGEFKYNISDFNTIYSQPLLYELDFKFKENSFIFNSALKLMYFSKKIILTHFVSIPHSLNDIEKLYQDSPSKISIEFNTKQKIVIFGNIFSSKNIHIKIEKDNAIIFFEENDYYINVYTDRNINETYFSKIAEKLNVSIYIYTKNSEFRQKFIKPKI